MSFDVPGWLGITLFAGVGLVFLGIAARMLRRTWRLIANGVTTEGRVGGLGDGTAIVRFKTAGGESIEFETRAATEPPSYRIGQRVKVIYNPNRPRNARTRDFLGLYLASFICAVVGGVFFLLAFFQWME